MTEPFWQSNFGFRLMSLIFHVRDWFHPPAKILQEAGVRSGMTILDIGCGPGSFSLAAATMVGPQGRVYALDIHPLAIRSVERAAFRHGLNNVRTILGDNMSELEAQSVDLVLLYDVVHGIPESRHTVEQIHRVLKPEGVLSVSDHHLSEKALLATIMAGGYFQLTSHGTWTYGFQPTATKETATAASGQRGSDENRNH
jgi:2-polyprenyl-3-methyl-5-hydroxy-6-metoxy-1,4-benzoquinol methylase